MLDDIALLRETIKVAEEAKASGNHPFGAILVSPAGEILLRQGNTFLDDKGVGHAELNLARRAARTYEPDFLEGCTLYTSIEPCSMCAGGTYWAGIGALVYGVTEVRLAELTGDNPENLTMALPCRTVFDAGQRKVEVRGPYPELEDEIIKAHQGFW